MIPVLIWILVNAGMGAHNVPLNPYADLKFSTLDDCRRAAQGIQDASKANAGYLERGSFEYSCIPARVLMPVTPQNPPVGMPNN